MSANVPVNTHSTRVDVIDSLHGRILCVADVRGAISTLNSLAAQHDAIAIIHSGDFGFYEPSSIPSISDRTLKHLVQYSSLMPPHVRSQLLSPATSPAQLRHLVANHFDHLSEFPKLVSGQLRLAVPVYTVWGACEDVRVLEKIRVAAPAPISVPPSSGSGGETKPPPSAATTTRASLGAAEPDAATATAGSYSIPNLTVLDEATTRVLNVGGIRLRLFGLGGAVVPHKLFDNGTGNATIAGGMGTMWTTMLQIGELVDTAQKVYDPTETRLLITHASPGREGLISQLSLVLKADLTVSAGLHFRYGVSYNEFSVTWDPETFRNKLEASRKQFGDVWDAVKTQVEGVVDDNQKALLANALAVANRVPGQAPVQGGPAAEETAWKNCWNWNLPDAAFGSLVFDIREGRIGTEMKSQGFNFAYRSSAGAGAVAASSSSTTASSSAPPPPAASTTANNASSSSSSSSRPTPPVAPAAATAPGGGGRPPQQQFHQQQNARGFPPHHHRAPRGPGGAAFHQQQQQQQQLQQQNASASATANSTPVVEAAPADQKKRDSKDATVSGSRSTPPSQQSSTTTNGQSTTNPAQQQQPPPPTGPRQPAAPGGASTSSNETGGAGVTPQSKNNVSAGGGEDATTATTTPGGPGTGRGGRGGRGGSRGTGGGGGGGGSSRGRSNGEWRGRGGGARHGSRGQSASSPANAAAAAAGGGGEPSTPSPATAAAQTSGK